MDRRRTLTAKDPTGGVGQLHCERWSHHQGLKSMPSAYTIDARVELPRGLVPAMVQSAVRVTEDRASDLVELYHEQRNAFSTIVGIFGARALAAVSPYEPSPHRFLAQGAFPDLRRNGARGDPPPPRACLESKASIRRWPIQAHYNHEGWYIVVDESLIFSGKPVVIWRVDVLCLKTSDWKYEGSKASAEGGGSTHTFGAKRPATKLAGARLLHRNNVSFTAGKPVLNE